jgi:hypothetical protein
MWSTFRGFIAALLYALRLIMLRSPNAEFRARPFLANFGPQFTGEFLINQAFKNLFQGLSIFEFENVYSDTSPINQDDVLL